MVDPVVSLWAMNLARTDASLDAWLARVDARVAGLAERGATVVVLPEYACASWLAFAPASLGDRDEVAWLAARADEARPRLAEIARARAVTLLAGTSPRAVGGAFRNTTILVTPEGERAGHDKLVLTPWERDDAGWTLAPGDALALATVGGARVATPICLDVESPALAARLLAVAPDLLLVPSMTSTAAGYHRVFDCAKARAIELCCPVAVVGAVGTLRLARREETNVSGAAFFLPCESSGAPDGLLARLGPVASDDDDGPVLTARVPVEACRRLRAGGADVWPLPTLA